MSDRKMTEDRAISKILWGESEGSVRDFLKEKGFSDDQVDETIQKAIRERAAVVRKRGITRVVFGAVAVVVCGGILGYLWTTVYAESDIPRGLRRRMNLVFWGLVAGTISGLTIIGRGLYLVSHGSRIDGQAFEG